jgi:hypothetical protein
MASTLITASISARLGVTASWGTAPAQNRSNPDPFAMDLNFGNGTTNGNLDRWYAALISLGDGANTTLDVRSLTDVDGATVTMAEIVAIAWESPTTNTTIVTMGASGTNQLNAFFADDTDAIPIRVGQAGILYVSGAGGYATSSTDKDLKFTNAAGAAATIKLWLLGRSA